MNVQIWIIMRAFLKLGNTSSTRLIVKTIIDTFFLVITHCTLL